MGLFAGISDSLRKVWAFVRRPGSGAVPDFTVTDCREYSKLPGIPARRVCLDCDCKLTQGAEVHPHAATTPIFSADKGCKIRVYWGAQPQNFEPCKLQPFRTSTHHQLVVRPQPQPFFDVSKSSLDDIDLTPRSTRSVIQVPETIQCEYVQKPLLGNALGSPQLLSRARTSCVEIASP